MKRVLMMEFTASGNRRNPVVKDINEFEFPDPKLYFKEDPVLKYFKESGIEAVPFFVARARGMASLETFIEIVKRMEDALEDALKEGPIDGIWFYTYAQSYIEFIGNGEEFMVKKLRNRIGYDIPIAIPMDFHGLITPNMAKMVNIVCTFRTNPHTDVADTRMRAAKLLKDSMGYGLPQIAYIRIPMLAVDSTRMDVGAGAEVINQIEKLEAIPGVASAALVTGILWNNVPDGATCLLACTYPETDKEYLKKQMKEAAESIWNVRGDWVPIDKTIDVDSAFETADVLADNSDPGVVFLNDSGDNPTGPGVGDSAYMLSKAIESGKDGILVNGIWASGFMKTCVNAYEQAKPKVKKDGNLLILEDELIVEGNIGADVCKTSACLPIKASLLALRLNDADEITGAKLQCGKVVFLVTKNQEGVLNRTFSDGFGTNIEDYRIVIVKLGYLVPEFLEFKKDCFMVITPGVTDLDFKRIEPEMDVVIRPVYPFDDVKNFKPALVW